MAQFRHQAFVNASTLGRNRVGAAKVVGAHDRIGQIGVGMEADLLIWKGHPFEGGSRLERVFVNGEEVQR